MQNKEAKISMRYGEFKLYEYIKERSQEGLKTNYEDILENPILNEIYGKCRDTDRYIRKVVRRINSDGTIIQKPIISGMDGYYIAHTDDEFQKWADRRKKTLLTMIKEFNYKCKKNSLNGQMIIIYDEKSKARDVFESRVSVSEESADEEGKKEEK